MIKEIEVNPNDTIREVRLFYGLDKKWKFVHKLFNRRIMVFEKPEVKK